MTESEFKVGDIVILQNLKIHPEFNGLETTVIGPREPRESWRGVEPMPIEYLYEVDINPAGFEPGLLVAEYQMRHKISGEAPRAPPTHRNELGQHLELQNPVTLEDWQSWLHAVDSATTFPDYSCAFQGAFKVTDELQKLLDDFGAQTQTAVFAVRHGIVEGVWFDPHHNYLAIVFTKASGDPEDCVLINSFALPT